jgi:hypothetical protein
LVGILAVAHHPGQEFSVVLLGPDPHGQQEGTLEAALLGPLSPLAILVGAPRGQHLGHPDGVHLENRGHRRRPIALRQLLQMMQSRHQCSSSQGTQATAAHLPFQLAQAQT